MVQVRFSETIQLKRSGEARQLRAKWKQNSNYLRLRCVSWYLLWIKTTENLRCWKALLNEARQLRTARNQNKIRVCFYASAINRSESKQIVTSITKTFQDQFLHFYFYRALYEFLRVGFLFFFPAREKSISGEVALVTGAGQGIGRALALELAKKGAIVICVDIRQDSNEETVRLVQENRSVAFSYTCDVSCREQVEALEKAGHLHVSKLHAKTIDAGVQMLRECKYWGSAGVKCAEDSWGPR